MVVSKSSSIMSYQCQTRKGTKKVLIKRLPKTTRNVIFVLGFSMVTMAGVLDRAEPLDQSILFSKTAEDIAITSTAGQLTRFDHLLVPGYSNFLQRCYISSLHELNKAEAGVNLTGL